jgi:hypothetical protein
MITGAHFLLYSTNADADRAFFRDIFNFKHIDLGGNWLIFALPPAEMAVHPASVTDFVQTHAEQRLSGTVLYLMCDDLKATMQMLELKHIECTPVMTAEWGSATTVGLPSGGRIGLYQPTHPTAIG